MSDMKCPFCQQELDSDSQSWEYGCSNPDCQTAGTMCGTKELWQELIRTRKALDVAVDALKTVKKYLCEMPAPDGATVLRMACESATTVKKALEQITALEQGGDNGSNS